MTQQTPLPQPSLRLLPRSRLTVSTILREPPERVMRFVAWYLAQDADRIVLCFDDPDDPSIDMLAGIKRVECIRCTPDFWQGIGIKPDARFSKRQNRAMAYVYSTVAAGWLLNVDCDELVHLRGRTLATEVDRQGPDIRALRILPAEHILTPDSPKLHFRTPMNAEMQRRAYGGSHAGMTLRMGLMGHYLGKSVTRAGLSNVTMRQHWMLDARKEPVCDRLIGWLEGAYLLHFIDTDFRSWCGKLPTRMSNRWFPAPVRDLLLEVLDGPSPEPDLRKLFDTFFVFDEARLRRLANAGARLDMRLDPDDIAVAFFRDRAA